MRRTLKNLFGLEGKLKGIYPKLAVLDQEWRLECFAKYAHIRKLPVGKNFGIGKCLLRMLIMEINHIEYRKIHGN